jgi:hypothetical protein
VVEQKHVGQEREFSTGLPTNLARSSDVRTIGEYLFAQTKEVLKADGGYLFVICCWEYRITEG